MESLIAAVRCGADAVYLGVRDFNARQNAKNFDFEELKEAVDYCHGRNVNVHLTLNTLVSDEQFQKAAEVAIRAAKVGVDAIIIQDFGLVRALRKIMPDMPLHASTQMSVQTEYGLEFLSRNGFTRAVLPRELSREEILYLLEKSRIELEMFVHGALCMCVSGQCYMSAFIGGRSGNRGLCAQPCRLPFTAGGKTEYALSLKDNSLIPYLAEMKDRGMASFKIEGRMKRPEYVAASVTACRNSLAGIKDENIRSNLKNVFSRSGFTDGYFTGKIGKDMFGIRSKNDVEMTAEAVKELGRLYEKEKQIFPVDFFVKVSLNEKVSVTAKCREMQVTVLSDFIAEKGENKFLTEKDIKAQFEKTGGTKYHLRNLSCEIEDGIFISSSKLNLLRREILKELDEKLSFREKIRTEEYEEENSAPHRPGKLKNYLVFYDIKQVPENTKNCEIFLPVFTEKSRLENLIKRGEKVGVILPRGLTENYKEVFEKLKELKKCGIKKAVCPTLDGLEIARENGYEIIMGFGSNIYNTPTLKFYEEQGVSGAVVSAELTAKSIEKLGGEMERGVIAYGKIPLMLTRNCPVKNDIGCENCKGKGKLTDRKGVKFEVVCSGNYSEILNAFPIYIFDKKDDFKSVDFFMLFFTTETKKECEKIIEKYFKNEKCENDNFTRGLYYRGT